MSKNKNEPELKNNPPGPIWEWPNGHYNGPGMQGNGFDVRDGKIYLSPGHRQRFTKISEERAGVHALLEATNAFCEKRLRDIQISQTEWFKYVLENIGASHDHDWLYDYVKGCLKRRPKQTEAKEE